MRRALAFDPPEYVAWTREAAHADVLAFDATYAREPARRAAVEALDEAARLDLYRGLLRARLTDHALARLVREGLTSKAWLGTGEEATTIGPVHALRRGAGGDVVAPLIRNAGACAEMGMPIAAGLRAYLGTADSPSAGRDGHYGDLTHGVLPPVSALGTMVPVAAGVAQSFKLRGSDRVALTWIGDGGCKTGPAHEGLNYAAALGLPLIVILQDNGIALGTVRGASHAAPDFRDWPRAYGVWGGHFDGNNVLDAYAATRVAVERCRAGLGPALLVAETQRMGGHATHDLADGRRAVGPATLMRWGRRDPVALYEEQLVARGVERAELETVELAVEAEVAAAEQEARASWRERMPVGTDSSGGVYGGRAASGRAGGHIHGESDADDA